MGKITIEKGRQFYFFTTTEDCRQCPKCKKTFIRRFICPSCQADTEPYQKVHTGKLSFDFEKRSCDCAFGSWFKFGGHWKKNHPQSECRHVKLVIRKIKEDEKNDI